MDFLSGYKTIIAAVGIALVTGLQAGGIITVDQATSLTKALEAFGLYGIALKLDKLTK